MELGSMARREVCLRLSAILVLVTTACVVGFDKQTKVILNIIKKQATFRDVEALKVLVYVTSAAAAYNFLQLCKHFIWASDVEKLKGCCSYIYMAWICFLLDQVAVYMTFAANSAALEASVVALTGEETFQWLKVCNKYTRFCNQIGGSLLCGYVASILMAIISSLSAYNLFSFYSPNHFLRLKTR